jgi:hypothetical protein
MKTSRNCRPIYPIVLFFLIIGGSGLKLIAQPALGTSSFPTASTILIAGTGTCTGGKHGESAGFRFSIYSAANCALNNATGTGSDGHINLFSTPATTGIWLEGRIASNNGSEFQLDNFVFSVLTAPFIGKTFTMTGYRDGIAVPGATAISPVIYGLGLLNPVIFNVSSNSKFDNIDEFRLTPSGSDAQGTVNIQSITISPAMSTLPVNFLDIKAVALNENIKVNFSTSEESEILNYDIQVSTNGTDFATQKIISANNTTLNFYEVFIPSQPRSIWIRVVANETNGTINYSRIVHVKPPSDLDQALTIYPNPVKQTLFVDARDNQVFSISNLQGIEILKGKITNGKITVGSLKRGVYILRINQQTVKLIKD